MVASNCNVSEDRSAIEQALAILGQEGPFLGGDSDSDSDSEYYSTNFNTSALPRVPISNYVASRSGSCCSASTYSIVCDVNDVNSRDDDVSTKIRIRGRSDIRSRRKSSQKKSVRFSMYDQTVLVPHILDFTPEEIQSCWMDEEHYRSIRSRSLALIEMLEDETKYPVSADYMIVNQHLVCVRGLGEKTSKCSREVERIQRKLYGTVLRLQDEQRDAGVVDAEALRQASKKYSKKSMKTARFVGISDQVNASSRFG